ncbi:hypothetical protein ENBRE01_2751 [Enteropsectra breve]|nr:hypothetical protein ENBRE01_2751 [Enteropsectra breve]
MVYRVDGRNRMFLTVTAALEELLDHEIILEEISCEECGGLMKLVNDGVSQESIRYACKNNTCRHLFCLFTSEIQLNDMLFLLFCIFNELSFIQIENCMDVAESAISSAKNRLATAFKIYNRRNPMFLGGPGVIVECGTTVLSPSGIVTHPAKNQDDIEDTVWILACIDRSEAKNFNVKRIKKRSVESITDALSGEIQVLSAFYTDGHPSYPAVAANLGLEHRVVNRSHGIGSEHETHTKKILGFWSSLKAKVRNQGGVQRSVIDDWLEEYTFYRRFIQNRSNEEMSEKFIEILKIVIKNQ